MDPFNDNLLIDYQLAKVTISLINIFCFCLVLNIFYGNNTYLTISAVTIIQVPMSFVTFQLFKICGVYMLLCAAYPQAIYFTLIVIIKTVH